MQKIHLEAELFADLLQATSEYLSIPIHLIEKDYHISSILRALSQSKYASQIVFKGGTSLSKGYRLISRFSEDVDLAVLRGEMSGNQVKTLLGHLAREITTGLREDVDFPEVSKGSRYRKQAFIYDTQVGIDSTTNPVATRIILEVSAFANPFPYERREIEPFVTTFLRGRGLEDFIMQYSLEPFELNVLSLEQTLCEKIVSLLRFSMSKSPVVALASKIRHFYDLHALLSLEPIDRYIQSEAFRRDMALLLRHDQQMFGEPEGWKDLASLSDSPLVRDFDTLWSSLIPTYQENLSLIVYRSIPSPEDIKASFTIILRALEKVHWR